MTNKTKLLSGVKLINLIPYIDDRGFFLESYNMKTFKDEYGIDETFVQDNHSYSKQGVLRGLHYQVNQPQGKLVRVLSGVVYDVCVDLRQDSPTYCEWMGITLSARDHQLLWIPPGFAHGFLVLSPEAHFLYKTTDFYHPEAERCLLWNDPTLNISWPTDETPILSPKDLHGSLLKNADLSL